MKLIQIKNDCLRRYRLIRQFVQKNWKQGLAILVVVLIFIKKDVAVDLSLQGLSPAVEKKTEWLSLDYLRNETQSFLAGLLPKRSAPGSFIPQRYLRPVNTSMLERSDSRPQLTSWQSSPAPSGNVANTFSNLTFSAGDFATRESDRSKMKKRRIQEKYLNNYYRIAQQEMEKYGIPASITLAQGLLESNAGESRLAQRNNNHFGIKCFSKSCRKGHCSNFTDDHHKDFFRIYKNPEESYHAHSALLKSKRYKPLFKLPRTDYRAWAYGLKKAGYATDKYYAEKLINLIEDLDLHRFDY